MRLLVGLLALAEIAVSDQESLPDSFAQLEALQPVEESALKKIKKKKRKEKKSNKSKNRGRAAAGDGNDDGEPSAKRSKGIKSERKLKAQAVLQHKAGEMKEKKEAKKEKRRLRKEQEANVKKVQKSGSNKYDKNKEKRKAAVVAPQ